MSGRDQPPPGAPAAPAAAGVPALHVDRLTRRFRATRRAEAGEILALDAVSLSLPQGRLMGLLGPNGAGKTTLLRLVCGLLRPTAGRVEVLGADPAVSPAVVRRQMGAVLGGERSVYWRLTGRENLLYAAALHGVAPSVARARAEELLHWVGLVDRGDDLVERYSTGMRLRLAVARALVHDPALLVLDEPTAGLDPHAARELRAMLAQLRPDPGRTIVIATHNMLEAERLCDVVAILDRGRLVAFEAPAEVIARVGTPAAGTRGAAPAEPHAEAHAPAGSLEDAFMRLTTPSSS